MDVYYSGSGDHRCVIVLDNHHDTAAFLKVTWLDKTLFGSILEFG
jgi:hypothetical protein